MTNPQPEESLKFEVITEYTSVRGTAGDNCLDTSNFFVDKMTNYFIMKILRFTLILFDYI